MVLCSLGVFATALGQILFGSVAVRPEDAVFNVSRLRMYVTYACSVDLRHLFSAVTARVILLLRL